MRKKSKKNTVRPYAKRSSTQVSANTLRSWLQAILPMMLLGLLISLFYWGYLKLRDPELFPFRHVRISADADYVSTKTLHNVVLNNLYGSFFHFDSKRLKEKILALPWVSQVALRRKWPSTLSVQITEHQPLARWGNAGIINEAGELFSPPQNTISNDLPILVGPQDAMPAVLEAFRSFDELLATVGLSIAKMQLSERGAWRIKLSNGVQVVIGHDDAFYRFRRFVSLYPRLIGNKANRVAGVDLRYTNGLAIKWKK